MRPRRRWTTGAATVTALSALAVAIGGCTNEQTGSSGSDDSENVKGRKGGTAQQAQRTAPQLIGDGSTARTGQQPHQPVPKKLKKGKKPPQFVVFSWDGAGEDSKELFSRFRKAGKKYDAAQTYFLTGLYVLPEDKSDRYRPPQHAQGASDIGFLKDENVRATLKQMRAAWRDGSEIGTHFNGHFCGADGVNNWSAEDWKSEIRQAKWMVENWKTTTGWKGADPLPFDYGKELIGGRTPCLEGQENLMKAASEMGFRYDSSGNGKQVWPGKKHGLWDIPLQAVPIPGRNIETLSMDYNFMANQSVTPDGPKEKHAEYGRQMREGLLAGFDRAYKGNRAPLIIGNHFEDWNGGVYMDAIEHTMKTVCPKKDVRCVSFRQLVDWLDEQDPKVLDALRGLEVGQSPKGGWKKLTSAAAEGTKRS
ncbi:hypothetical protein [Streptomyces sp. HNM0574]|uniref:hypothetical protein n=1 Tax=Streptomyces sp. HNM0574 TaxID=2714954 RepID=UPI0014699E22|nr:hypothetical protein [Streptomyces sp. HNM0574]NLU67875.1 hypothetical protein [Streptomyces sp. HNM0574]